MEELRRDGIAFEAATAQADVRNRVRSGQPLEVCGPAMLSAANKATLKPTGRVRTAMQ